MQAKFLFVFLLGTSIVNGNITVSNSPNSPYRKLSDLTEDITVIKQEVKNLQDMQSKNEMLAVELDNFKKLYEDISKMLAEAKDYQAQLKTENEALKAEVSDFKKSCEDFTQSKENFEKNFCEETTNKLKELEQKQISDNEMETFLEKYKKLDTFNDVVVSVQKDLSELKDANLALDVAQKKLQEDLQTFANKTDEKFKNIEQANTATNSSQTQFDEFKKDLISQCESICEKTANDLQTKIDSLKSRTFSKHTIVSGETLNSIAKRYSTSPEQILITNNIQSARDLRVGDTIIVPNNL